MKNAKLMFLLISCLGIVIFGVGVYLTYQTWYFLNQAAVADGVVVDYHIKRKPHVRSIYQSVVEFSDQGGVTQKFTDPVGKAGHGVHIGSAGSNRKGLNKIGEKVEVLYMADDPEDARIDRGIWNWAASFWALLIGAGMLLLGFGKLMKE